MRKSIFLVLSNICVFALFATSPSNPDGSKRCNLDLLGGYSVSFHNLTLTASVVSQSNKTINVSWDNSHTITGYTPVGILLFQTLERSNPQNGYDTIFTSRSHHDTLFVDTLTSNHTTVHYRLIRREMGSGSSNTRFSDTLLFVTTKVNTPTLPSNSIKLYPNPTNSAISIELDDNLQNAINRSFQISNISGQQVMEGKIERQIDIQHLPSGTYYIKLDYANKSIFKKFVVVE